MAKTATHQVMSDRALNRATLARQLLLARARVAPAAAIERLAGMQAQLARPPFVGLWTRLEDFARADLLRLLERREVVRGTLMRATIHLVTRDDYLAMRPAIQPVLDKLMTGVLGKAADTMDIAGIVKAARAHVGRQPCTFEVMRQHLLTRYPALNDRAMGLIVRARLPLVQVPVDAAAWGYPAAADFAVAETFLGEKVAASGPAAALAVRYLAAFGPASVQDFQTWSGLHTARPVFEELRPKLVAFVDARGRELFDLPKAPRDLEDAEAPVRLLPEYDNLLLAYADRSRLVNDEHKRHLFTANLQIPASFLLDGRVSGTWRVDVKKPNAVLQIKPFAPLSRKVRGPLVEEAERLLRFIEPEAKAYDVDVTARS